MFIIRRAFRCGAVSRADLLRAANISTATATRTMAYALNYHGAILERKGRNIVPKPLAERPSYATEVDLLKHIDSGQRDPIDIGFFEDELPICYVSWTNSMPPKAGTLETIVSAIKDTRQIDIIYLGVKISAQPRARKILPLCLEKMNDQWRVVAQDLEDKEFTVKVFVLPRILAASRIINSVRIPYTKGYVDSLSKLSVTMNHKYTPQQKQMLENELKVSEGKVSVSKRSLSEFKRRFLDIPISDDVVWPPLIIKEE